MKGKTTFVRIAPDLAAMISVIAWLEGNSCRELIDPILREPLTARFRKLPKSVRDRANKRTAAAEPAAA